MRLTPAFCKRIRHDFLPVYIKKQWREQGSHMTGRRLRVPPQVLSEGGPVNVAEDMFSSRRYEDALDRELSIGALFGDRAELEAKRQSERLAPCLEDQSRGHCDTAPFHETPTLAFDPTRLFCKDIAQACLLTNVGDFLRSPLSLLLLFYFILSA